MYITLEYLKDSFGIEFPEKVVSRLSEIPSVGKGHIKVFHASLKPLYPDLFAIIPKKSIHLVLMGYLLEPTNQRTRHKPGLCAHLSFEDLIDQGFVAETIVNFVALLGWSPADNNEIMSLDELIKAFDYHHINKAPAVFDMVKLRWMNGEYLKAMDDETFFAMAKPYIEEVIKKPLDLKKISGMIKTRIETFLDIKDHIDFFETMPEYDPSMYVHKKMKTDEASSLTLLQEVLPLLKEQQHFSNDALFALLKGFASEHEYKTGFVMWPIRTAVSGKQNTPGGATELMEVLGKEESLLRIQQGIDLLS